MAVKFNPFTGQLQIDEKGSGGGSSYIDGEVATYNDLPLDGTAPLNSAWLVRTASGVWPVSRKQAGIYIRTATAGSSRDADYTYAGTMPDVFSDAVFTLYDEASTTRTGQFNLGSVTAGQNRVLTWPDGNGTIARTSDIPSTFAASAITSGVFDNARINFAAPSAIGSTTAASGAFTTLSASGTVSGTGFSNYLASPPAIGGTSAAAGSFTTLSASTSLTLGTSGILSGGTNTIEQRNTTSAQTFRIYNTVSGTADANYERGFMRWNTNVLQIGTEKAGTGSARALEFQTDGTTRAGITSDILWVNSSTFGNTGMQINPAANRGGIFVFEAHVQVNSGQVQIRGGAASTDFIRMQSGRLMFSGTDNTFPALKRSSTTLQVRLADDSAFAPLEASGLTLTNTNTFTVTANATSTLVGGAAVIRLDGVRLAFATGGTDRLVFSGGGDATFASASLVQWLQRIRLSSPADGQFLVANNAGTDFDRVQLGGTTSSFPAIKRSSAILQARLADDSGYTVLDAQLRAQGTAPATSGATGTAGDIRYDADYIYVCTAANTWKRAAIATW